VRADAGYTLVELLVAAALLILLTAFTCTILADTRAALQVVAERADVHQRGRVALDFLAFRIRGAGAGPDRGAAAGPLVRWLPPIRPGRLGRRDAGAEFSTAVWTVESLPGVPPATLAFDAPAGAAILDVELAAGCALPCGFVERLALVLVDPGGDFDVFVVTSFDGVSAAVRPLAVGTGASFPRGTPVLPVDVRGYYWNAPARELRVFDADGTDLPAVDNVVAMSVEYFAAGGDGTLQPLSAATLEDGPWRGLGSDPLDADLLQIRAVRVSLRLQASSASLRGTDAQFFRNPGTAIESRRMVSDLTVSTVLTPANLGGAR
jgi:hypothetical protein